MNPPTNPLAGGFVSPTRSFGIPIVDSGVVHTQWLLQHGGRRHRRELLRKLCQEAERGDAVARDMLRWHRERAR
ncbi:MAG: hypothetical protein H0W40_03730 [Methylibium sp.]|uniref:hypothetical protein n=1 Tax=Methylibium sp. TaxID=2067992 RepID=UPI00182635D8|nr:hypothetical protein [Methylibium sp.]MBA3596471.1 hypothetical protein [Methylibium sp.]